MKLQTSTRNPPSTGYVRPTEHKFFIWQDRFIHYEDDFAYKRNWETHPWRWCCTLCDPPSYGFRAKRGAWRAIIDISMRRHFLVRHYHHEHVLKTHKLCPNLVTASVPPALAASACAHQLQKICSVTRVERFVAPRTCSASRYL